MNTQDLAVSVHRLTKRYGHTEVLKDVNMEIEKGSIYCLLGSNGAGKTTTIKILTTLAAFDSGEVSVCGHSVTAEGEAVRKLISLTGQFASVDEKLSGYENLVMIGKLNHLKTPKKKAGELLAYFSLTEAANRMVSTYSGGMRRKLDIAMSLAGNPQIIFLDEPTTGLDPQSRHSMWSNHKAAEFNGDHYFSYHAVSGGSGAAGRSYRHSGSGKDSYGRYSCGIKKAAATGNRRI